MSFNFNKKGKTYEFHAAKHEPSDFGVLSIVSQSRLTGLEKEIGENSRPSSELDPGNLDGLFSCLERLSAALYYSKIISDQQEELWKGLAQRLSGKGELLASSGREIGINFESFLFHGRACLDRLTLHANRAHGQNSDRYSKLSNVLANVQNDDRASELLKYISDCSTHFSKILVDGPDKRKSIRSQQMHRSSITQSTDTNFCMYNHPKKGFILFDYYFLGYPLLNTVWNTTKWLTYLILNSISIYLPNPERIEPRHCRPSWTPKAIPFSEYETSGRGIEVSLIKLTSSGFKIENKKIRVDALDHGKLSNN